MKKKFLSAFCLSIAAVVALSFIGCGGKESQPTHAVDTYSGAISTESYASVDEAAKAFVDNEISGAITSARFVSYSKQAELSNEEVDTLDIPQDEKARISVVERGEVKYSDGTTAESGVRTSADGEKSFTVLIVTYNDGAVKFYSPKLNTGDVLTKSYFDKLFAVENFESFTASCIDDRTYRDYGSEIERKGYSEEFGKYKRGGNSYVKDSSLYLNLCIDNWTDWGSTDEIDLSSDPSWDIEEAFEITDKSSEFCGASFVRRSEADGKFGEWRMRYKPNADKKPDLFPALNSSENIRNWLLQSSDHTYFIKTDTGFKLNTQKEGAYSNSFAECLNIFWKDCEYKIEANYRVEDGKLTEVDFLLNAEGLRYINHGSGIEGEEKLGVTWKLTVRLSDYGTTVVDIPEDLDLDSFAE